MLELLSAQMNQVPIVLFKVLHHSNVGFPGKLERMQFPGRAHIKTIKYIKHSRDYFDACMRCVHDQFAPHIAARPEPQPIVQNSAVMTAFEQLRQRRNAAYPGLRPW